VVFGKNQASFLYENVLLCILVEFNEHEVRVTSKRNVRNGILGALGKCIEFRIVVGMWIVR
jgi:hypothetical protein